MSGSIAVYVRGLRVDRKLVKEIPPNQIEISQVMGSSDVANNRLSNTNLMDRKDKILLLQNIMAGKVSIDDLKPKQYSMRIGYSKDPEFFINGKPADGNDFFKAAYHSEKDNAGFKIRYGTRFTK